MLDIWVEDMYYLSARFPIFQIVHIFPRIFNIFETIETNRVQLWSDLPELLVANFEASEGLKIRDSQALSHD